MNSRKKLPGNGMTQDLPIEALRTYYNIVDPTIKQTLFFKLSRGYNRGVYLIDSMSNWVPWDKWDRWNKMAPGLYLGWLYSRHRTLIGVTLAHAIIGTWAIWMLGI